MRTHMILAPVVVLLALALPYRSMGEDEKAKLEELYHRMKAAWECEHMSGDIQEAERFFQIGYKAGQAYDAVRKKEGLSETYGASWWSVPSPDFRLGQLYATIHARVSQDLLRKATQAHVSVPDIARQLFRERHCALLGAGNTP